MKQVWITMRQVTDGNISVGPRLHIERCFGILVAPGRHVKHSDMQLLEMVGYLSSIVNPLLTQNSKKKKFRFCF